MGNSAVNGDSVVSSHNLSSNATILVVGLAGSGKKSVVKQFEKMIPKAKFKTEKIQLSNSDYEYSHHISRSQFVSFANYSLVVVVIDGADITNPRAVECTLGVDLSEKLLAQKVPVLFLANKSDKMEFKGEVVKKIVDDITKNLGRFLDGKGYCLQTVSAITGEGIEDAVEWGTKNVVASHHSELC
jgi:ABC-type dipeptide/oligopeptide/nickel transport system ATPase component